MKITERACPGQFPGKDDCSFIDYQNWYAIQVLLRKIQLYLPTRKVIHQLKGVQHIMELPLFPGYIFVYISISESLDALDKAKVRIEFMNRFLDVSLGLEILSRSLPKVQ